MSHPLIRAVGADSPALASPAPGPRLDPDLLSGQPHPVACHYVRVAFGPRTATAIFREWGSPEAMARCGLCDRCMPVTDTACMIGVTVAVADEEVSLFDATGFRIEPAPSQTRAVVR